MNTLEVIADGSIKSLASLDKPNSNLKVIATNMSIEQVERFMRGTGANVSAIPAGDKSHDVYLNKVGNPPVAYVSCSESEKDRLTKICTQLGYYALYFLNNEYVGGFFPSERVKAKPKSQSLAGAFY